MENESLNQLSTLSHEGRNAIFRLLMRRYPDAVPAGEIAFALGQKASTASANLAALREAGLITQARQGTSLLYRANVSAAQGLVDFLFNDCCRGRPDICPPALTLTSEGTGAMPDKIYSVLFICTGNSARSIIAETLLRDMGEGRFTVQSAGTKPFSELNPIAVQMLRQKGHDISALRAKNVKEFQGQDVPAFDFVFTVCDLAANEDCPPWEGQPISAHWGLPDPVKATGTDAEKRLAFQQTYGALRNRIAAFTALPLHSLDRISLQAEIDRIAETKETDI